MTHPETGQVYSWRVAILPFLDEKSLFEQYRFDEPWDSDANRALIAKMPAVFRNPMDNRANGFTSFFAPVGERTILGAVDKGRKPSDIVDGASQTLMFVEAKRDIAWTQPEDVSVTVPPEQLGGWHGGIFVVAWADGSINVMPNSMDRHVFRQMLDIADGESGLRQKTGLAEDLP